MIRSKDEMYTLLRAGRFGNRLLAWQGTGFSRKLATARLGDLFTIRYSGLPGQNWPQYACPVTATQTWNLMSNVWPSLGANPEKVVICEAPPDDRLIIQGEVAWINGDLEFRYSKDRNVSLRNAMYSAQTARGSLAEYRLKSAMTPESWRDLVGLLLDFPDHAIEVSVWDMCLGDLPNRNAIVWEVRAY